MLPREMIVPTPHGLPSQFITFGVERGPLQLDLVEVSWVYQQSTEEGGGGT